MKLIVDTKALKDAMGIAGRVVPVKTVWPILTNIKFVANDDRVTLIGSDGDMTFEADVPAEIETEGEVCVPFASLSKFMGAAKSEMVKISDDGKAVKAQAGRSSIALSPSNLGDYPNYRPIDGDPVVLDVPTFCHALRFCAAAVQDSEVKFHIAGPNISEGAGELHVWGTDGQSAHHAILSEIDEIGGGGTLPIAAAQVVLAVAEKVEAMRFMINERGWFLDAGSVRVWGKVIDSPFPDMAKVEERFTDWQDVLHAPNDDLANAISVATCGSETDTEKSSSLILRAYSGQPVVLRGRKSSIGVVQAGRAEIDVEAQCDGCGVASARLLTSALSGLKADDVSLSMSLEDGFAQAVTLKPSQRNANLQLSALILAQRASQAEVADV
ncbi:DNA polymerase III subunit beta [uncultured Ruegeria sp.]|uniref:DNA polymerase III subunit beta n=1 Tax=uncultured Ruegeria sp. TaxID=259304 RepID=UPI0026213E86|nr:DNA polymerase III subunit beta [uncultured Ruegeria sp.]